ncbi:hypothetical protein RhiJN_18591 [Ceratobasidium sp. AG-Ba]|nr:hypothetical protein RhiJN_18591 [Ceratobasidium sp. AG-Ba]
MTTALKNAFEGSSFPSIRTVIMPNCAHEILRCCPHVESVTCNEDDGGKLASALVEAGCSTLQVARGFSLGPNHLKRFTKAKPPLRLVRVKDDEATVRALEAFPSLRIIEIECHEDRAMSSVMDLVEIAKNVLRSCAAHVPPPKPKKGRKAKDIPDTQENLSDLHSDPRTVKVRYYLSGRFRRYDVLQHTAVYFVPTKIDTFPL